MNWPPGNEIVIDANVFRHMCDRHPEFNVDGQCTILLGRLASQLCILLVDNAGLFYHEWFEIVKDQFGRESEIGGEIAVLRYWADRQNHSVRNISSTDELASLIKGVIREKERFDCAYVYLSFNNGRVLITNDLEHIIRWPHKKKEKVLRRDRLLKGAADHIQAGVAILTSCEAYACMEGD
jgi:hypothetical protein